MVNSFVDEVTSEEQDPGTLDPTDDLFIAEPSVRADAPHKHSIHLSLEDSTFTVSCPRILFASVAIPCQFIGTHVSFGFFVG